MNLAAIREALNALIAAVEALEAAPPVAPPAANTGNAYDACKSMWKAAESAGLFSIHAYIGPGITQGAGQIWAPVHADPLALEQAIRALGWGTWGQSWLANPENRAVTDPAYVRMFGFKPVERLPDNTLREYD